MTRRGFVTVENPQSLRIQLRETVERALSDLSDRNNDTGAQRVPARQLSSST